MGVTLDDLLQGTGVNKLAGKNPAAPEPTDILKLAERCRRAAEASPQDRTTAASQDLVEKTAAVEIIRRTLAEIRSIDGGGGVKTASADAEFIKAALAAGHEPEAIARFLEQVRR